MASEIRVPRLGWSMEEGVFLGWRKRDGESVQVGEVLYELEGEKASQEIEALDAGVLRIAPDAPASGTVVPVGTLLGYVATAGESIDFTQPAEPPIEQNAPAARMAFEPAASPASHPSARPSGPPSARRRARRAGQPPAPVEHAGGVQPVRQTRDSGTVTAPVRASRHRASPRARRVARELGLDCDKIAGSGTQGRVREQDVRAAAGAQSSPMMPAARPRRSIAERMLASHRETAPVTLTITVDATNLVSLRTQFKSTADAQPAPAYTDFAAKLVALALRQHPLLAAQWHGDRIELPPSDDVDIGIAVDTPQGLLVPVLRRVRATPLLELAAQSRELFERARGGRVQQQDLEGGVFTISSLGGFGIEAFTPLINYPQCAILGLGAIRRLPACGSDGQFVAREMMTLSLTFDHRIVDGAPAARFLQTLREAFENPSAWLLAGR